MILKKPETYLNGIAKPVYKALESQNPEIELLLVIESGNEQVRMKIFKDDEVELIDTYIIRKNTENDYEMIDLNMFTRIEVLTMEGMF